MGAKKNIKMANLGYLKFSNNYYVHFLGKNNEKNQLYKIGKSDKNKAKNAQKEKMLKLEKIERLVELALISGYIKNDNPLSLILIAEPETAKTKILSKFDCKGTKIYADISQKEISKNLGVWQKENIHHIIIPDLTKVISHRLTTVDATISYFNALMEEGIKESLYYGQSLTLPKPYNCGLLTAITTNMFYTKYKKWDSMGFLTRFLPVSYDYNKATISEIHNEIKNKNTFNESKKIKKYGQKYIEIPEDIASMVNVKTQELAERISQQFIKVKMQGGKEITIRTVIKGFRLHYRLRQLIRAIALSNNNDKVTWKDAEEFYSLIPYINFPKTKTEI